jgi:hypothetical protein
MDESNSTCNNRFAKLNIPQTVEARRAYREKGHVMDRISLYLLRLEPIYQYRLYGGRRLFEISLPKGS